MGVLNWFRRRSTLTKIVIVVGILLLLFLAFTIPVGIIGAVILGVFILLQRGVEKKKKPMIDRLRDLQKHKLYGKLDNNIKADIGSIIGGLEKLKTKGEVKKYKEDNSKKIKLVENMLVGMELNDKFINNMKTLGSDPVDKAIFDIFNDKTKKDLGPIKIIKDNNDIEKYNKAIMRINGQLKIAKKNKLEFVKNNLLDKLLVGWIKLYLDNVKNAKKENELPKSMSFNMSKLRLNIAKIRDPKSIGILKVIFKDIDQDIQSIDKLPEKERDIAAKASTIASMKAIKNKLFG
jgi:hypothetical protein